MDNALLFGFGVLAIVLLSQRWFWLIVFGVSCLASAFSTLASIFHFQILGALGFFFLTIFLLFTTLSIADGYT